jgi:hypothetical protein
MRWSPLCFLICSAEAIRQIPGSSLSGDFFETFAEDLSDWTADQDADVVFGVPGSQTARHNHVSGMQRAASLNQCGAAKQWNPAARSTAVSEDLKTVYALNGKAASSMLRQVMAEGGRKTQDPTDPRGERLTWFSFVRDPVLRSISGFFEIHIWERDVCMERAQNEQKAPAKTLPLFCNVGVNPHMADPEDGARVLARFEAMVTALENGTFQDAHLEPQHNHVYAAHRLSFIGRVEELQADWNELGELQAEKFGVSWPALPNLTVRSTPQNVYEVFGIKSVPDDLVKRLCKLYKDDYCCHQLRFPAQCHELSC